VPAVSRRGEGGLDLAEDLRLAHHHRIEPAGDLDQVAHGLGAAHAVEAALEFAPRQVVRTGEPVEHPLLGLGALARDRDELGTVTGRKDHRLGNAARAAGTTQRLRHLLGSECHALAHLDGRGGVVETDDQQAHE
jgi:hypothetical protein